MKKVKVLFISRGFGDYIIELLNSISKHVEAHMAVCKGDEWVINYLATNIVIHRTNAPRVSNLGNLLYLIKLYRLIKKISPDIIHFQSGVIWELVLFKTIKKSIFVVTVHDIFKHPMIGKYKYYPQQFLNYCYKNADAVILHGETLEKEYRRIFRKSKSFITNIHHGPIQRYGTYQGSTTIKNSGVLFFGSLNTNKGIECLLKAVPIIKNENKNAKFIIAGNPAIKSYYENLSKKSLDVVWLLGNQSDEMVKFLFNWADVLVLPYIEASQSGVLQLGFAHSIPPVVTSVGGLPDVVKNELNGLVVAPNDHISLAMAIIRLLNDKELRFKIIANINIQKINFFSWTNISKKTKSVYINLLIKKRLKNLC